MLTDLHFLVLFDELIKLENLSDLPLSSHNHLSKSLLTKLRSLILHAARSAIISWQETNIHSDDSIKLSISTTLFQT